MSTESNPTNLSRKDELLQKIDFLLKNDMASPEVGLMFKELQLLSASAQKEMLDEAEAERARQREARKIVIVEEEKSIDKAISEIKPEDALKAPVKMYKKVPRRQGVWFDRKLTREELNLATSIPTWEELVYRLFEKHGFKTLSWAFVTLHAFHMQYRPDNW